MSAMWKWGRLECKGAAEKAVFLWRPMILVHGAWMGACFFMGMGAQWQMAYGALREKECRKGGSLRACLEERFYGDGADEETARRAL